MDLLLASFYKIEKPIKKARSYIYAQINKPPIESCVS